MELVHSYIGGIWLFDENIKPAIKIGEKRWATTVCSGYFVSGRIRQGDYENNEVMAAKLYLKPGMTCIDVGANVGLYSVVAAQIVGNEGRVFAFEPDPEIYKVLSKNATLYNNIQPFNYGLHDHDGTVYFKEKDIYEVELNVKVGDECLKDVEKVDFIKIDVDGAEPGVLKGLQGIIDRSPTIVIFCEFSPRHYNIAGFTASQFFDLIKDMGLEYGELTPRGIEFKNGAHSRFIKATPHWKRDLILWRNVKPFLSGM